MRASSVVSYVARAWAVVLVRPSRVGGRERGVAPWPVGSARSIDFIKDFVTCDFILAACDIICSDFMHMKSRLFHMEGLLVFITYDFTVIFTNSRPPTSSDGTCCGRVL